jgi:hypothetical protein
MTLDFQACHERITASYVLSQLSATQVPRFMHRARSTGATQRLIKEVPVVHESRIVSLMQRKAAAVVWHRPCHRAFEMGAGVPEFVLVRYMPSRHLLLYA